MSTHIGTIVSLNISPKGGIPKIPQDSGVFVGRHGFEGDYHNRETRESNRNPGTFKENKWHISILAAEVYESLNADPRLKGMKHLVYGDLGENVTVRGLGDLAEIADGTSIKLGRHVTVYVIEHMQPCVIVAKLHKLLPKCIMSKEKNRRGLYCAIESGGGSPLTVGSRVEILPDFHQMLQL